MFKKMIVLGMLMFFGLFSLGSVSFAQEIPKEKQLEVTRSYIENNVIELNGILSLKESKQDNLDLQSIEALIDEYYSKNPAPHEVQKLLNDETTRIDDIFPSENSKKEKNYKKGEILNINKALSEAKVNLDDSDSIYEFSNPNGVVTLYLARTGDISIIDRSFSPTLELGEDSLFILSNWKTTRTERITAVGYNGLGAKMFTFWAEGNFQYNGTSAKHGNADGDVQRHFWGSGLTIENRSIGEKRNVLTGNITYPEVFTRIYVEAVYGYRFLGVTINSATLEAYVGASYMGNIYSSIGPVR